MPQLGPAAGAAPAAAGASDFFWTDFEQAHHRLYGTVVCYEGRPVYVVNVENHPDVPRGTIIELGSRFRDNPPVRKMLNDPGFGRFRTLPKLGWVNFVGSLEEDQPPKAYYLKRRPVQGTQHGLCSRNVQVLDSHSKGAGFEFTAIIGDDGFIASQNDDYPPVDFILESLPRGAAAGVSLDYAIVADSTLGLRYLVRRDEKIGVFQGDEIRLPEHMLFLRGEIHDTPAFAGRVVAKFEI